jgi:hypothetical protein
MLPNMPVLSPRPSAHPFVSRPYRRPSSVPEPDALPFRKRLDAAAATARKLADCGMRDVPLREERALAADLLKLYCRNGAVANRLMGVQTMSSLTPAALLVAKKIVDEYSAAVVADAAQIRALVLNKLIIESNDPDPKVRLKACELLGKVEDVGLFKEKSDGVIRSYSVADLHARLKEKLGKLVGTQIEDAVLVGGEVIDVDSALGLEPVGYESTPASHLPDVPDDIEDALRSAYGRLQDDEDED